MNVAVLKGVLGSESWITGLGDGVRDHRSHQATSVLDSVAATPGKSPHHLQIVASRLELGCSFRW